MDQESPLFSCRNQSPREWLFPWLTLRPTFIANLLAGPAAEQKLLWFWSCGSAAAGLRPPWFSSLFTSCRIWKRLFKWQQLLHKLTARTFWPMGSFIFIHQKSLRKTLFLPVPAPRSALYFFFLDLVRLNVVLPGDSQLFILRKMSSEY